MYLAYKSRICGEKRRSQATCDFEWTQVTLGGPNWDTNFIAPLRMPLQWSKGTVGSLRSVFIVLMRTPSFLRCPRLKNGAHLWPTRVEMTWKSQCCCLFIKKTSFLNQIFIFFYAFRFLHQTTLTSWQENFIVSCIETTIMLKHFQGHSFKDNFLWAKLGQPDQLCFILYSLKAHSRLDIWLKRRISMRKNLENGISPRLQHITSLFETTLMYFTNILFVHAFELKTQS